MSYEEYKQTMNGTTIYFLIDNAKNHALFTGIDFSDTSSKATNLKLFCVLLRNATNELISMKIDRVYQIISIDEFTEFKKNVTWETTKSKFIQYYANQPNFDKTKYVTLVCNINNFIENMDIGLDITTQINN